MSRDPQSAALGFATYVSAWPPFCAALIVLPYTSNAQTPARDVAAQVREQGYPCYQPITAIQDIRFSKPDSAVWVLKCRNARYRVRLDPDMAARITKLKK